MKIRSFAALASLAALCACGGSDVESASENQSARSEGERAGTKGEAKGEKSGAAAADPALEREIAQQVDAVRSQLPIQQGPLTISEIKAEGTELTYVIDLPSDIDNAQFEQFATELKKAACDNPQATEVFGRGGIFTYQLRDTGGEQFSTSISSC